MMDGLYIQTLCMIYECSYNMRKVLKKVIANNYILGWREMLNENTTGHIGQYRENFLYEI